MRVEVSTPFRGSGVAKGEAKGTMAPLKLFLLNWVAIYNFTCCCQTD